MIEIATQSWIFVFFRITLEKIMLIQTCNHVSYSLNIKLLQKGHLFSKTELKFIKKKYVSIVQLLKHYI